MSRYARDPVSGSILPVAGGGSGAGHTILDEGGVAYPQRSKLQFEGCEITDDAVNGVTVVKCEGGGTVIVEVPTVTNTELIYDGTTKSPTITRDTAHTTITGTTEATEFGSYTFTISLSKPSYIWSDNTIAPKTYAWGVGYDGSTITPVNDIQTWLKCAMITDKSYTTLSEVLNDATTLSALMLSNNAVDYLVRSISWVSDITGNQTAMTDIGTDDYCADTLLADSTWRQAICDSSYMESVLNVKVPTMTSNTTPSGECFGHAMTVNQSTSPSYDNEAYYKAFDLSDTQYGYVILYPNDYVGYGFENNVNIKKIYLHPEKSDTNYVTQFKIQGSNDKETWTDLKTVNSSGVKDITSIIETQNSYRYFRVYCVTAYAYCRCNILQFYGRNAN